MCFTIYVIYLICL